MNRQPYEKPPRWWSPKLRKTWVNLWRPLRLRRQRKNQRLVKVAVEGQQQVRQAIDQGKGVLITPNHSSHADGYALYAAADTLGVPVYAMACWQRFHRAGRLEQAILQQHGCFSVDREGTDMRAFRQSVSILNEEPFPLVIFPEGDVYHTNERLTPFREGAAAIAVAAARRQKRPIVCVPCAIHYRYVEDPTPDLLQVADAVERSIGWRPRPDLSLEQRIYHLAEGLLAMKEVEYLGRTCSGPVRQRVAGLIEFILTRMEHRYELDLRSITVPERVKALRRHAICELEEIAEDAPERGELEEDLEDLFLVIQAFSYPGDYVREKPSVERIAETLDKFEEDVLGASTATIRGTREARVVFGEPIPVPSEAGSRSAACQLTLELETRLQSLLDDDDCDASLTRTA